MGSIEIEHTQQTLQFIILYWTHFRYFSTFLLAPVDCHLLFSVLATRDTDDMRFAPSTPFPAFCTSGQISRRQIFQRHISRDCCHQPPISPQFGTSDTFSHVKHQRKVFPPLYANKWINPLVICVSLVWLDFLSLWIHSKLSTTATFGTRKGFLCREVVVVGAREGDTHDTTGHDTSLVSPSRAPILFFAHYFQAPTTQAMVVSESPTGLSCSNAG